jgi:hypothetical protein
MTLARFYPASSHRPAGFIWLESFPENQLVKNRIRRSSLMDWIVETLGGYFGRYDAYAMVLSHVNSSICPSRGQILPSPNQELSIY